MVRLRMKKYNMISVQKLQKYQLLGKINKHKYLTGEEILPSNQKQIIEQAKFTYSPLFSFSKLFEFLELSLKTLNWIWKIYSKEAFFYSCQLKILMPNQANGTVKTNQLLKEMSHAIIWHHLIMVARKQGM